MRLLYLVRHGETLGESSIRYHGRGDVRLSDLGRRQAARLAALIRDVEFEAQVHSPLARAEESAQILLAGLEKPPSVTETDPALIEVDFGAIEGMTEGEIEAAMPDWHREWKAGRSLGFPGGETVCGFAGRIAEAIRGILARHPEGHLLLVAHRGVIKWSCAALLGLSPEGAAHIAPDLGSLTILRAAPAWELLELNLVP